MQEANPINPSALLRQHGLRPDKALGQNFLIDEGHLASIVRVSELGVEDQVLEVGAGLGSLTRYLAVAAKRVVAVELDKKLFPILEETISGHQNVELVLGDILKLALADYFNASGYKVVANIPYYLTTNLIRHLLEGDPRPAKLALTIQREVAERACASPPNMSLLSLSVQLYGSPRIAHHIPAGAFYPSPKVDSALLIVDLNDQPKLPVEKVDSLFRVAKAAFSQKRKTLANSLASLPNWTKEMATNQLLTADIDPKRRPQTLSLEEWGRLI
jgi:16S rRNA (adenine1518-N6/adenine1519-N6)-dimethyltransferase